MSRHQKKLRILYFFKACILSKGINHTVWFIPHHVTWLTVILVSENDMYNAYGKISNSLSLDFRSMSESLLLWFISTLFFLVVFCFIGKLRTAFKNYLDNNDIMHNMHCISYATYWLTWIITHVTYNKVHMIWIIWYVIYYI